MAEKRSVACPQCSGTGTKTHSGRKKPEACRYCGGTGKVWVWK